MNCMFKIIQEPTEADKKIWGVLAHVTPETRKMIQSASAGEFKQYVSFINQQLKQLNKGKRK